MNNDIKLFKDVLTKFRFVDPVPLDIQKNMIYPKRELLINILKHLNRYNPVFGIILFIFFLAKRIGINLSIIQSSIVLGTLSLITAAGISTGTYVVVKHYFINESTKIEIKDIPEIFKKEKVEIEKQDKKLGEKTAVKAVVKLGIFPFTSSSVDKKIISSLALNISSELSRLKGNEYSRLIKNDLKNKAKYNMFGSLEYFNDSYILVIKVVESATSSILFQSRGKFSSIEEINKSCEKISKEIAAKID